MPTAEKILITGGVSAIMIALLLGFELVRRRRHHPANEVRIWITAHETILLQGFMMFGLSLAVRLSNLSAALETTAAWLIVAAAASATLANILNAAQKVDDQFARRSIGLKLNSLQAILLAPAVAILLVGVVRAL